MQGRRRWTRLLAVCTTGTALSLLLATAASAAELHAAELEGTTNNVSVPQGGAATFMLSLTASGMIRCAATSSNPATATLPTQYALGATGGITVGTPTAVASFYADPNCNVTWAGHPTPQILSGTISAHRDTPLGAYGLRLRPQLFTPFGSGEALVDRTATLVTLTVVEPSDITPPVVTCDGPFGTAGAGSWFTSPVRYDCAASDAESGLADPADATFSLTTAGEGSASTGARVMADQEGNAATAGPFGPFDVDLSDPLVAIDEPADGAVYVLGQEAAPAWRCDDAVSGVASCERTGTIDTSVVGPGSVTVTATDRAGRTTTLSHVYSVVYDVDGPFVRGEPGARPAGAAVPIWWSAEDATAAAYLGATATAVDCASGEGLGDPEPVASPGNSTPTYDDGTFKLVVMTSPSWAGRCVSLGIRLDDGTTRTLTLSFESRGKGATS